LLNDDKQISVKFTNASNTPIYLQHKFADKIDTVSLKDSMWLNLSVNATKPTTISLLLQESSKDHYGYMVRINDKKLMTNTIENITIPIIFPDWVIGTPDLSQIESIVIRIEPSADDNHVTFHILSLTG